MPKYTVRSYNTNLQAVTGMGFVTERPTIRQACEHYVSTERYDLPMDFQVTEDLGPGCTVTSIVHLERIGYPQTEPPVSGEWNGACCPKCGADDEWLHYDDVQFDAGMIGQGGHCDVCQHLWLDEYVLVRAIEDYYKEADGEQVPISDRPLHECLTPYGLIWYAAEELSESHRYPVMNIHDSERREQAWGKLRELLAHHNPLAPVGP